MLPAVAAAAARGPSPGERNCWLSRVGRCPTTEMGAMSGICPVGAVAVATWVTWAASWESAGLPPRTGFNVPTAELDSTVVPGPRGVRICGKPRRMVGVVTTVAAGGPVTATTG